MQTVGIDIVDNNRIKKILDKNRDSFYNRIFTGKEIQYIVSKNNDHKTVAGLFSVKESISKAVGTGIGKLSWKDVEIYHDKNGKPGVKYETANKFLEGIESIEISISHEKEYAISTAIINWNNQDIIKIPTELKGLLIERKKDSHKGSYGKVGVFAGSKGMVGANYLTCMAALRTGSGIVYSIVPKELVDIMSNKFIEVIVKEIPEQDMILNLVKETDGLAIGPGLGNNKNITSMVKELLLNYEKPIVLDADGINCISRYPDILKQRKGITIITPHPGELAKLINKDIKEIQENRVFYSKYVSKKYNIITLLKGYNTIVTDGDSLYINHTGNPGMSTAGCGDVLTGIIISFICQGIDPMDSVKLGAFVHGLAGDKASEVKGENGMIASDILNYIPETIKKIL